MNNDILWEDKKLKVYLKKPGEDSEKLDGKPCGRLDKPVGGLMLLAKDGSLQEKMADSLSKVYYAVISGILIEKEGILEDYLLHDKRKNKVFPVKSLRKGVKEARLSYKVISENEKENLSLVRVVLDTGRTHQIRVQFASRKHPLFGDGKYGSRLKGDIGLFAGQIKFAHPVTGEQMNFKVLPEEKEPWSYFTEPLKQDVFG